MQNLWIQEASNAGRSVTKKVGTNVNPADLMTKPRAKPKIEQLMSIMGYEFLRSDVDSLEGRLTGARWYVRDVGSVRLSESGAFENSSIQVLSSVAISSMMRGTRISVNCSGP